MLTGLPEYGVTLSGSLKNPILENRSGKAVIGYRLKEADQNGHGMAPLRLLAFSGQPAGIPDGGAVYVRGNVPVNRAGQVATFGPAVVHSVPNIVPAEPPVIARVTLLCALLGDGQLVGADEEWVFEQFGRVIKVMAEVGLLAKAGAWDQLEALDSRLWSDAIGGDSSTHLQRRTAARFLVRERKWKGDAAAAQLAEIYSSLPTVWK